MSLLFGVGGLPLILFFLYLLCWAFVGNPFKAAFILILLCILGAFGFLQHVAYINHTDRRCQPIEGLLNNGGCGNEATSSGQSD